MSKREACVWIVEQWWNDREGWTTTCSCPERTRKAAQKALKERRAYYGVDFPPKLRVSKYVRAR